MKLPHIETKIITIEALIVCTVNDSGPVLISQVKLVAFNGTYKIKTKRKELTKYPNSSLAKARGVCSKRENQKM